MKSAVLLWSGGLDSTTLLYHLIKNYHVERLLLLSAEYGNQHREPEAFARDTLYEIITDEFDTDIRHLHLAIPLAVFKGGDSALVDGVAMPVGEYHQGPNATEVPFRNAVLISMAVSRALVGKYEVVAIANHATDADAWAYPDCTPEFIGAMMNAVWTGSYGRVRLTAPFQYMDKASVVSLGNQLLVPFGLTWSCYAAHEDADEDVFVHCGTCPTCIERHKAFCISGIEDPTEYENAPSL